MFLLGKTAHNARSPLSDINDNSASTHEAFGRDIMATPNGFSIVGDTSEVADQSMFDHTPEACQNSPRINCFPDAELQQLNGFYDDASNFLEPLLEVDATVRRSSAPDSVQFPSSECTAASNQKSNNIEIANLLSQKIKKDLDKQREIVTCNQKTILKQIKESSIKENTKDEAAIEGIVKTAVAVSKRKNRNEGSTSNGVSVILIL
jgi:hypothetical protein